MTVMRCDKNFVIRRKAGCLEAAEEGPGSVERVPEGVEPVADDVPP
jgi:hypothetical protein